MFERKMEVGRGKGELSIKRKWKPENNKFRYIFIIIYLLTNRIEWSEKKKKRLCHHIGLALRMSTEHEKIDKSFFWLEFNKWFKKTDEIRLNFAIFPTKYLKILH